MRVHGRCAGPEPQGEYQDASTGPVNRVDVGGKGVLPAQLCELRASDVQVASESDASVGGCEVWRVAMRTTSCISCRRCRCSVFWLHCHCEVCEV